MSETIWKAEAEAGLVAFIKQYMTLEGKPVNAFVRLPDEDLKEEIFPCMSVFNIFDVPNEYRRQRSRFIPHLMHRNYDKGEAIMTKQPLPVDALYQIDFWSFSNRQINEMTNKWMDMCEGYFNLDCEDVSSNLRNIFCRQVSNMRSQSMGHGSLRNSSYGQYDQARRVRVFNSSIDYRVWLEIFEKNTFTRRIVTEVSFRLHVKN